MDREQAKDYVKAQLEGYLHQQGINTRKPFCCLNPDHTDSNPSMSYDRNRNKVHCFSCGADYDIIDLIKEDYGLSDDKEAFNQAYELYRVDLEDVAVKHAQQEFSNKPTEKVHKQDISEQKEPAADYTNYFIECNNHIKETDYPAQRGLTAATIDKYKLGFDKAFKTNAGTWEALIIPTTKGSFTVRNTAANVDKKNRIRKTGNNVLFNVGALKSNKPIFVVEGELDALSIIEVSGNALALGSTANYHKLVSYLKANDIETPMILLALDNDEDGKKTTENILKDLAGYKKAEIMQYNLYGDFKDANEMLVADRMGLMAAVQEAENIIDKRQQELKEEYLKNNTANHLQEFLDGIKGSVNTPFIPTGFQALDKVLDGGLYEGLYIIGAISSLGKTTYIMQIADQIAQQGNDVLIFSLEMARSEIISKSISRLTLLDCIETGADTKNAKTSRGITTGKRYAYYNQEEKELIKRATINYGQYATNIFICEGIGDIGIEQVKETVKQHISFTGKTPIVIIDYLQILAPYEIRATDKQNTDKAVLELKRLSRDYKTPVIGISSFNRQNYNQPVSMEAFKESGAVEYSADVLMGLQIKGAGGNKFDVNQEKRKNPRNVELVILKNRNGATGDKVGYEYYTMFNYFKETGKVIDDFDKEADTDGWKSVKKTPFK